MKQFGFGVLGVVLFLLAGWLGYRFYPAGDGAAQTRPDQVSQAVRTDTRSRDETELPSVSRPAPIRSAQPEATDRLQYLGYELVGDDNTKVCFNFNEALPTGAETDLKSYVAVKPETPFSLSVEDRKLCALGLKHTQDYVVTLRAGLEAANGWSLPVDRTAAVSVGAKPALVAFVGDGIILPRLGQSRLTIKTVNVDEVEIKLYRVNHRILSQTSPGSGEANLDGEWGGSSGAWGQKVEIHSETLNVKGPRNTDMLTAYDVQSKIAGQGPGAFIIEAQRVVEEGEDTYRVASAWRWIMSTDMALTSYRGGDGMTVSVRSIETAELQPGVRLDLIARNNDKLAELVTDREGRAKFASALLNGTGPLQPRMVMAYGEDGDFAILDMTRSPLDLSAMDVEGREMGDVFDVFAYTERGIYRPGETVHYTALLRDRMARAKFDQTLSIEVRKPDGELFKTIKNLEDRGAGSVQLDWTMPASAPRGRWTFALMAEGAGRIATTKVLVEDFVPEKLRLSFNEDQAPLAVGEARRLKIDAQFLYGAPGAGLPAEAEARVSIDPKPFPDFNDYRFGDMMERYEEQLIVFDNSVTDETGLFETDLKLEGDAYQSSHPLRALVTVGVADTGGRFVRDSLFVPIRSEARYIGFKPEFSGRAPVKSDTKINLVMVDKNGDAVEGEVDWTLIFEDADYHWYRDGGRWRYRRDVRDIPVEGGTLRLDQNGPTQWSRRLDYGHYRLAAKTADGRQASLQFRVGWGGGAGNNAAPDRLQIGAPDASLKPGESFELAINAPYAGRGDLVIAGQSVLSTTSVDFQEGLNRIQLNYDPNWGPGVHALVTLYTPIQTAAPRRAVGVAWLGRDVSAQTLDIDIQAPDKIRPRQTQDVVVKVANAKRGENVFMTLAAVDQGILQITKYDPPNAPGFFFAKRAFPLSVRDDYARILNPFAADPDRFGGDSLGGSGLAVVPTRTVALFSGIVQVKGGQATIPLDMPDYIGELTLMVTAWSDTTIGSASQPMTVRDPVSATFGLPRFLAPDDKVVATISVANMDGTSGEYVLDLKSGLGSDQSRLTLETGDRRDEKFDLTASGLGVETLSANLTGPGSYTLQTDTQIQIREPKFPESRMDYIKLTPGQMTPIPAELMSSFKDGTIDLVVETGLLPRISAGALIRSLNRYPYGCLEQTVSTARPMLHVADLGGIAGQSDVMRQRSIRIAIDRMISRQDSSGVFGMWRRGDGRTSSFAQLYATEFLLDAQAAGFEVPQNAIDKAVSAARKITTMERRLGLALDWKYGYGRRDSGPTRRAERAMFAHYILARAGKSRVSDMRYVQDEFEGRTSDAVTMAYLGSALSLAGEEERADQAFAKAAALGEATTTYARYRYYSSPLRDRAAVATLAYRFGSDAAQSAALPLMRDQSKSYYNTQEKAYLIRLLAQLSKAAPPRAIETSFESGDTFDPNNPPSLKLDGDDEAWAVLVATGIPKSAPVISDQGVRVTKTVHSMDGEKSLLSDGRISLAQGERAVIKISARLPETQSAQYVLADLLPAGFEIETVLTPKDASRQDGQVGAFAWLGKLTELDLSEARDDRYVASDILDYDQRSLTAAYIVRAVSAGDFVMPGAVVENMYRPETRGRSAAGRLFVTTTGPN